LFKQPLTETIIDHQIHSSSEYSMVLTDEGNVHFYHIAERASRGSIKVTKGAKSIAQDQTGLYMSVVAP
jgi:hypothetical protein